MGAVAVVEVDMAVAVAGEMVPGAVKGKAIEQGDRALQGGARQRSDAGRSGVG